MVGLSGPPEVPLPAPTQPSRLTAATGLVIRLSSPCPEPVVPVDGTVSTDGENALFDIGLVPILIRYRVLDISCHEYRGPFLVN